MQRGFSMDELTAMAPAMWIWDGDFKEVNQYVQFFGTFTVKNNSTATLYISADMNYAAFVNGHYVEGFAYSDYPDCRSVDILDITEYVKEGKNNFCVTGYCPMEQTFCYQVGSPKIRFCVYSNEDLLLKSDTEILCRRAPDYKSGSIEMITAQLGYTFHYDSTKSDDWLCDVYVPDASFKKAVISECDTILRKRPIKQLELKKEKPAYIKAYGTFKDDNEKLFPYGTRMQFSALSYADRITINNGPVILPLSDGIYLNNNNGNGIYLVLDLKEETAGLFALDIEVEEETEILIGFGEHLDDLRVRTFVGERQFAAYYKAKKGRQTFTDYFRRFGARYIQLHIYSSSVRIHYAGLKPVEYPLSEPISFKTGDYLLDKIYCTAVNTLKLCLHEHYEDCPWREQGLYAMDSMVQMLCGYYAFKEIVMPRAAIELLSKGQRADGLLNLCAPCSFYRTIPSFSLAFISSLWNYYSFSHDKDFIKQMIPVTEKIIVFFVSLINKDGLIANPCGETYWNFFEWTEGLEGYSNSSEIYSILQSQFIIAAEQYLKMVEITESKPVRNNLGEIVSKIRTASQLFWNDKTNTFRTELNSDKKDTELAQSLMVCANIATSAQKNIILEKLSTEDNGILPISLSYSIYKYDALMTEPVQYAKFVKNDIAKIWGSMLFDGATSFWETRFGAWDFNNGGSLCHGWSAVPVYVFQKYQKELF